ncbi:MAG: DUF4202 domain-containing protein [Methylotenera sp.]|nr:DUF4202 domain-containing protein [Methylotenera sp.]
MKTSNPFKFSQAIARFDELNALDPVTEIYEEKILPKELIYAQRMSKMLNQLAPNASEVLQLAVRCQHIQRWQIPRASYPMTKPGYHEWRNRLKKFHADIAQSVLKDVGYDEILVSRVCSLVRKDPVQDDDEAKTLEDVVVLVFLESYLGEFVASHADYEIAKFEDILVKSLRKMSKEGRSSITKLIFLPDELELVLRSALAKV